MSFSKAKKNVLLPTWEIVLVPYISKVISKVIYPQISHYLK